MCMRICLAIVCGCLAGCSDDPSSADRCSTVLSWSSEPLGYDFMIADPVPVLVTEDGLNELLKLAPAGARQYENFCGAIHSNGRFSLTPNIPSPVESYTFRKENGQWKFVETAKISYLE